MLFPRTGSDSTPGSLCVNFTCLPMFWISLNISFGVCDCVCVCRVLSWHAVPGGGPTPCTMCFLAPPSGSLLPRNIS